MACRRSSDHSPAKLCASACALFVVLAGCAAPRRAPEDPETGAPRYDPLTAGTLAFEREPGGEPAEATPRRRQREPVVLARAAQTFETDLVVYDGKVLHLKAPIGFDADNLLVDETGRAVLEDVVWLLQETPEITKIEVQSHARTDLLSLDEKVTQWRADLVRDYLIGSGIDAKRVTAVGYEDTMPTDSDTTAEGRDANTRIELVVREVVGRPVSRRSPAPP